MMVNSCMPNLTYDTAFKLVFKSKETRFYIKRILETILKEEVDINQIEFKDTELITNAFTEEKGKITDCYVIYKKKYNVIFECNRSYYEDLYNLKLRYLHAIFNNSYKKGSKKLNNQFFILVNIDNFIQKVKGNINVYHYQSPNDILTKKIKVININLVELEEKWNKGENLSEQEKLFLFLRINHYKEEQEKLFLFLRINHYKEEKVKKLIEGDDVLMTLREELRKMSNEEILEALFDKDEEDALELEGIKAYERKEGKAEGIAEGIVQGKAEGKAEGIVQGKAEGIIEGKSEMVRAMYEDKMPLEKIAKLAKLSQAQLKQILML